MNVRILAATTHTDNRGWTSSIQIPTFYLECEDMVQALIQARTVVDSHKRLRVCIAAYCEEFGMYEGMNWDPAP